MMGLINDGSTEVFVSGVIIELSFGDDIVLISNKISIGIGGLFLDDDSTVVKFVDNSNSVLGETNFFDIFDSNICI